ncbi:hypothetical protein C1I98_33935, partial [Spongiactinospora gelatinilytica]
METGLRPRALAGLGVLAALIAGLGMLWAAAILSGNRYVALTMAALATAAVAWWALRRVATAPVRRWTAIIITASERAALAMPMFGGPPSQPIPPGPRTRYFDLPTGSRIAYTH